MSSALAAVRRRWHLITNDLLYRYPWYLLSVIFKVLWGFRVEGEENFPKSGPYILAVNEFSFMATIISGWVSVLHVVKVFRTKPGALVSYAHEMLWSFPAIRKVFEDPLSRGEYAPLMPHSAGKLSLNLLPGYKALKDDGVVVINPEGDMSWDGREVRTAPGLAWLALHTAAPVLPAICTIGSYDIWPRWQPGPSLGGRFSLRVGQPFRLCDQPMARVSEADLAAASAKVHEVFSRLRYGPSGQEGWIGPNMRHGVQLRGPVPLPVSSPVPTHATKGTVNGEAKPVPVLKRGVGQLLWRCPVCGVDDSITEKRDRRGSGRVTCLACETSWEMRRISNGDFRLKVLAGPAEIEGLDMALSTWYEHMKKNAELRVIEASSWDLEEGERAYLMADDVEIKPHLPSPLFNGWHETEAPRTRNSDPAKGEYRSIGKGQLLMTNRRLWWRSARRDLIFKWPAVKGMHIWGANMIGAVYGEALYQMHLGEENGLRWLTYIGHLQDELTGSPDRCIQISSI